MNAEQMYEIKDVTQDSEENTRRHFANKYFDLYIWTSKTNDEIVSFQLCYDIYYDEKDLLWTKSKGYSHKNVHTKWIQTPILIPDGHFDKLAIADKFKKESGKISSEISNFVHAKLLEYDK